jgi:hypothetical protein
MLRHFIKKCSDIRSVRAVSNRLAAYSTATENLSEDIRNYMDVKVENIRNFR